MRKAAVFPEPVFSRTVLYDKIFSKYIGNLSKSLLRCLFLEEQQESRGLKYGLDYCIIALQLL